MKLLSVRLPDELYNAVHAHQKKYELTIADIIRRALEKYLYGAVR